MNFQVSRKVLPWVLGALGVGVFAAVAVRNAFVPRLAPGTMVAAVAGTSSVQGDGLATGPLWNRIRVHIRVANSIGPMAGEKYAWSLEGLRKISKEVTDAIVADFDRLPRQSYLLRASLVFLVGELGEPAGVDLLRRLASSNERGQRLPADVEGRLMDPERSLRTTAIGGLMRHALRGSAAAEGALIQLRGHPDRSTRLMAEDVLASQFSAASAAQTARAGKVETK